MDKIVKFNHRLKRGRSSRQTSVVRPSRAEAEGAVRTLIRWAGDDPNREGLIGTPARVARAYEEWYAGYFEDPRDYLKRTFEEVAGYDEIVLLRDIRFESHCEHHMAPIIGRVHIGYLPRQRVVGISKLVRLVDSLFEATSSAGENDGGDRFVSGQRAQALRSRRGGRGRARMHDHQRRAQVRRHDGDELHAGNISDQGSNSSGVFVGDQPERCFRQRQCHPLRVRLPRGLGLRATPTGADVVP